MVSVDSARSMPNVTQRPETTRRQPGHDRIIGIHDQHAVRRQPSRDRLEEVGHGIDLAVPIQLVAEEVRHEDGTGPDLGRHQRERALVDLAHQHHWRHTAPEIGRCYRQRGHPLDEVRARLVMSNREAGRPEEGSGEPGGRGLAIGPGDGQDRHPPVPDQVRQDAGVQPPGDHPRQRGSAASTGETGGAGRRLARHERGEPANGEGSGAGLGELERRRSQLRSGRRRRS